GFDFPYLGVWRHDFQGWFWHINPCSYCGYFRQSNQNTESCNGHLLDKARSRATKRPRRRPGPSQTRILGRFLIKDPWEVLNLSDSQTIGATPAVRPAVSSLRGATFACAPRGNVMASGYAQAATVDNVDSRVGSQTYGLKKNCTAFSAVRG